MLKDLKNRWELLAEFDGHEIDDTLIAHLTKHHCSSEVPREHIETEESGDCSYRWAVLRSPDFFENAITSEMIEDLRRRWDLLAEFTGHRIDNALIAHLMKHHCKTVE